MELRIVVRESAPDIVTEFTHLIETTHELVESVSTMADISHMTHTVVSVGAACVDRTEVTPSSSMSTTLTSSTTSFVASGATASDPVIDLAQSLTGHSATLTTWEVWVC